MRHTNPPTPLSCSVLSDHGFTWGSSGAPTPEHVVDHIAPSLASLCQGNVLRDTAPQE